MKNLKKGDKLRVIDNEGYEKRLKIGDIVTFDRYDNCGDSCHIDEGRDRDIRGFMHLYRFERVEKARIFIEDLELARTFLNNEVVSRKGGDKFTVTKLKIHLKENDEYLHSSISVLNEVEEYGYCVTLVGNIYQLPVSHAMEVPTSKTVKLNDTYDAVVTKTEVKVGCQTFPIDKIRELIEVNESL